MSKGLLEWELEFLPMFGILGVDFGHGFDNIPGYNVKSGWQTHFTIGQQF